VNTTASTSLRSRAPIRASRGPVSCGSASGSGYLDDFGGLGPSERARVPRSSRRTLDHPRARLARTGLGAIPGLGRCVGLTALDRCAPRASAAPRPAWDARDHDALESRPRSLGDSHGYRSRRTGPGFPRRPGKIAARGSCDSSSCTSRAIRSWSMSATSASAGAGIGRPACFSTGRRVWRPAALENRDRLAFQ